MKIKLFVFVALCVMIVACSDGVDVQPDVALQNQAGTLGNTGNNSSSPSFNVATNFVLDNDTTDLATMSFGINQTFTEDVAIKPGFFIKGPDANIFIPIFSPYNDLVIPAGQTLTDYLRVKREDFGICHSSFSLKMEVIEVRIGDQVVPTSDYNVLAFDADGSTTLQMTGPGCSGSSQQPGDVSLKEWAGDKYKGEGQPVIYQY